MEIRTLITFIKVAEEQSLSKAGRALGYAQSTVTMQMQQLEQELGVSLYERVGRSIRLTQEGQELLVYAAKIVKTSEDAAQIGRKDDRMPEGSLRLGISDTVSEEELAERIVRFQKQCPRVELQIRQGDSQSVAQMVFRNEIDLMMTLDSVIRDPMLICGSKQKEELHFFAAASHPLASVNGGMQSLENILKYPLIRGGMWISYERDLEAAIEGKPTAGQIMIESRGAGIRLALLGAGVILLPDSTVKTHLESGSLVKVGAAPSDMGFWQQVLYHKNKWMTAAMSAWITISEET